MSKTIFELNALCDALSYMRKLKTFCSSKQMYKHFCKPGTGTISVWYYINKTGPHVGKIVHVHFMYTTWLGAISRLTIDLTKYY